MSCNINVVAFFLKGGDGRAEQGDQEQQLFQRMERFKKKNRLVVASVLTRQKRLD